MCIDYVILKIYRCQTAMLSKIAVQLECWEIRVIYFLEISSISNVNSIKIYIGTTMGYPTQFPMSGKLNKGDIEYHTSMLHDEINFDWSKTEFK